MRTQLYSTSTLVALAAAAATLSPVACEKSQPPTSAPVAQAVGTEKVFIEFRGPWAFAADPKDANRVLAIAPKAKGHRDLYVQASNQSTLASGVYDLSLPAHSGPAAATADPRIAQATIDAQHLQRALDSKSARYVIRLPKPEEYVVASRFRSRLGATYPPDDSTEKDYATAVSLRYNVSSLNGFSLAGAPDSGTFNPFLLEVGTPTVRFIIAPAQEDDPHDKCSTHSREAFRDMVQFLGVTLYVDFPNDPSACHSTDPQNFRPGKGMGVPPAGKPVSSLLERLDVPFTESLAPQETMSLAGADLSSAASGFLAASAAKRKYYEAAAYLFDHPSGDCEAPVLMLTTTP
jgi:hypothetical protein